jgi:hypothetical protein
LLVQAGACREREKSDAYRCLHQGNADARSTSGKEVAIDKPEPASICVNRS